MGWLMPVRDGVACCHSHCHIPAGVGRVAELQTLGARQRCCCSLPALCQIYQSERLELMSIKGKVGALLLLTPPGSKAERSELLGAHVALCRSAMFL